MSDNEPATRRETLRHDVYGPIHKGLRAFMQDTLYRVGRLDATDVSILASVHEQVLSLLETCQSHLEHENRFIHPALEARFGGGSARTASDHVGHARAIAELRANVDDLAHAAEKGQTALAEALARALYLSLSRFVAENYVHMHWEETENGRLLWALYTDAELRQIEHAIIAAATPQQVATNLRWMLPALTPVERASRVAEARSVMPADAFQAMLAATRDVLAPSDFRRLSSDLGIVAPRG